MTNGIWPVEVISVCDSDGNLKPLRFRYADNNQDQHVVRNIKVVDLKLLHYVGIEVISFTCVAIVNYGELKFELRYHVREHKWVLFRIIG